MFHSVVQNTVINVLTLQNVENEFDDQRMPRNTALYQIWPCLPINKTTFIQLIKEKRFFIGIENDIPTTMC